MLERDSNGVLSNLHTQNTGKFESRENACIFSRQIPFPALFTFINLYSRRKVKSGKNVFIFQPPFFFRQFYFILKKRCDKSFTYGKKCLLIIIAVFCLAQKKGYRHLNSFFCIPFPAAFLLLIIFISNSM